MTTIRRRRPRGATLTLLALLAGVALFATVRSSHGDSSRIPKGVIYASGNVLGFLQECGCKKAPLGGLDKRSGYIETRMEGWPGAWRLLLDVGNFSDTPGPAGEIKTRGLVEAMNMLGYEASGVGERDLMLGAEHLDSLAGAAGYPFLSANLVVESTGRSWRNPTKIVDLHGMRVGVTAVTRYNPMLRHRLPRGETLVARDPVKMLPPVVRSLEREADLVVVLALMPIEDARQLARQVPGIDVILGAHGTRLTKDPVHEGDTLILYVGDEGKYIGEVEVYGGSGGRAIDTVGRVESLYPSGPSDLLMEAHVLSVIEQSREAERLSGAVFDPAGEQAGGFSFLGAGACTPCHAGIVAEWTGSTHADAWASLVQPDGTVRGSCVSCHVTGHGQPGGFQTADGTPHLKGISCEACHGPAAPHVAQPDRPYGKVSLATCTSCHTAEQDADFNYYESLPTVNHGAVLGR